MATKPHNIVPKTTQATSPAVNVEDIDRAGHAVLKKKLRARNTGINGRKEKTEISHSGSGSLDKTVKTKKATISQPEE
ncbi:hypothetical protein GCM10027189_34800 [Rufibacter soli]